MSIFRTFGLLLLISSGLITVAAAQEQKTATWLMVNVQAQEALFVTDPNERTHLAADGWKISAEANLLSNAQPQTVAVRRFSKTSVTVVDRFFAVDDDQSATLKRAGYVEEGTLGQVALTQLSPDMLPVYHYVRDTRNLWLIDPADRTWAEKNGWKPKGVAFWVWPKA